jgi:hypothetical protein
MAWAWRACSQCASVRGRVYLLGWWVAIPGEERQGWPAGSCLVVADSQRRRHPREPALPAIDLREKGVSGLF